ncbi:MAG: glycine cleavage system protein H [Planctomycetes bacterium]|nr:glycine cleavage system protein H [Planctomycetota bacterium]
MTVLLVLALFVVFMSIDWVLERRRAGRPAVVAIPAEMRMPAMVAATAGAEPVFVAGYELPDGLHYHRGHTWARVVAPDVVAIGVDDFARRLTGRADAVKVPEVGTVLRQGARSFSFAHDGRTAELVSPVAGEIVEVNAALEKQPSLATDDPYGRGWICKVRSSELATNLRNLLSGNLARRWTEDAREQLELRLMALSGSVLQDGGEPAPDFADHLKPEEWKSLSVNFLLGEE